MTEREQFEKMFPVPDSAVWWDVIEAYCRKNKTTVHQYNDKWQAWQAARATPALPQGEHDLQDVRCQCCGYMTYHSEHMGCIRSAYKQALPQGEPVVELAWHERWRDTVRELRFIDPRTSFDIPVGTKFYLHPPKPQALPQGVEEWIEANQQAANSTDTAPAIVFVDDLRAYLSAAKEKQS